jgi:hypothetical protein
MKVGPVTHLTLYWFRHEGSYKTSLPPKMLSDNFLSKVIVVNGFNYLSVLNDYFELPG